jgi:hypothetical protein
MGIASNDLAPDWAIGLEAWPVALRVTLNRRFGWARSGESDAHGPVTDVGRVSFGPTERRS